MFIGVVRCAGDLRHVVVSCGGIDDVIAAMIRFPTDDRLHSVALISLADLLPLGKHRTRGKCYFICESLVVSAGLS